MLISSAAVADDSKLAKEAVPLQPTVTLRGKDKLCCGYPLVDELQWALRFYWLAFENDYDDVQSPNVPKGGGVAKVPPTTHVELYTPEGYYFGRVPERFAWSLRLEGSGIMRDGRVINYTGSCRFGYGTCFEQLDVNEHPFGRGNKGPPADPVQVGRDRSAARADRRAAVHPRVRRHGASGMGRSTTVACAPTTPAAGSRSARWISSS